MTKYSIDDIDRMRRALERRWTANDTHWSTPFSGVGSPHYGHELEKKIELQLRTIMQNGSTVEEAEAAARQAQIDSEQRRESITCETCFGKGKDGSCCRDRHQRQREQDRNASKSRTM